MFMFTIRLLRVPGQFRRRSKTGLILPTWHTYQQGSVNPFCQSNCHMFQQIKTSTQSQRVVINRPAISACCIVYDFRALYVFRDLSKTLLISQQIRALYSRHQCWLHWHPCVNNRYACNTQYKLICLTSATKYVTLTHRQTQAQTDL